MATPRLAMPYVVQSQAQKEVTHNEALNALDILVQAAVLDRDRTAPPEGPAVGDCHLIAPGGTGDWAGHDGAIAAWYGTAWRLVAPTDGMILYVRDEGLFLVRSDGDWRSLAAGAALEIADVAGLRDALDDKLDGAAAGGFATSAQGLKADTALQPADVGAAVQAHASKLDAWAALAWGADLAPWFTGEDSVGTYTVSAFMRGLAASASASALRRSIGAGSYIDPVPTAVINGVYASHVTIASAVGARLKPVPGLDGIMAAAGLYPGSSAFTGGVLLPDGRVFCVPSSSTSARIYDPVTDTLTTPSGTYPGSSAFTGGVLLPDGRVFCVPSTSTSARIYDPVTDMLTTPTGTYPGSNSFFGGVLLPDGRVFCVPRDSTSARIYDPVTDTLTTPSGTYPGSNAFFGGVLLPDGRVFCVPRDSTSARIYDPVTDTLTTPSGTYPGSNAFTGGVLLPNGRVFCVPTSSTSARIYDPVTDTLTTPSGTYPGSNAFFGGVLLPDGRVFCVPRNSTSAVMAVGAFSHRDLNFPMPLLLGGTLNKF